MSKANKIIHFFISLIVGLLNGYLIMVLLGYISSYTFYLTKWFIDFSHQNNIPYFYFILDFLTQISYMMITTFIIIHLTKYLLQYSLKYSKKLVIGVSTIGLIIFPFLFSILSSIYTTIKYNYSIHSVFISITFLVLLIGLNRYILNRYAKSLNI